MKWPFRRTKSSHASISVSRYEYEIATQSELGNVRKTVSCNGKILVDMTLTPTVALKLAESLQASADEANDHMPSI